MFARGRIMQMTEGGILKWASLNLPVTDPEAMHSQCSGIDKSALEALFRTV